MGEAIATGYQSQAADTTPEFDAFEFGLLRQRSCGDRLQMAAALTRGARKLSLASLCQTFPELSLAAFAAKVMRVWLGDNSPLPPVTGCGSQESGHNVMAESRCPMAWIQDSLGLAVQLHAIFDRADVPYYITGGLAVIAYGEPRITRNADIVLAISPADIDPLVVALEADGFYVPGVEDLTGAVWDVDGGVMAGRNQY